MCDKLMELAANGHGWDGHGHERAWDVRESARDESLHSHKLREREWDECACLGIERMTTIHEHSCFSAGRDRGGTRAEGEDHERLCRDIGQERMSMSAGGSASASDGSVIHDVGT